ncbi:macroglobulin / complement [Anaeramoeba flamelloides]|uniref:Macroglobulin / complement n=1 Tax=Anaeramoeba flamelloides TaxID=1746091 RepID=A0ABQ8YK86_9EUKA|nr:macroglobulin / complement [Anaeramoeba flamelloides]
MGNIESTEEQLSIRPRFSVHISTDKQTYKPGETLYCRAIILDCFTHKPLPSWYQDLRIGFPHVQILNSNEEQVMEGELQDPIKSGVTFNWEIPKEQNGGEYTIVIFFKGGEGIPKFERKFNIRKFTPKRFKTELKFKRKGYAAGEKVKAQLKVERSEGGIPQNAKVVCTARLDEEEIYRNSGLKVDQDGFVEIEFQLPEKIKIGVGSLNCVVTEGGSTETTSKTLPVALKKMDINIYPEGGYLVSGLPCGVYVEASNLITGDPADFEAILIEKRKEQEQEKEQETIVEGVEFKTLHEGRGRFEFTPKQNCNYYLKPTKPSGLDSIQLQQAQETGVSIRLLDPGRKNGFGEMFTLLVNSNLKKSVKTMKIGIYKRETLVMSKVIPNANRELKISFDPKAYDGVLRITVFLIEGEYRDQNLPIVERLIFIQPKSKLVYKIETEKGTYSPGDEVTINIKSLLKESGQEKLVPQSSRICITVTDDSVYQMDEKRDRAPRLPEMYFLENEVSEFKDPRVYISPDLNGSISADQEDRDIGEEQEIEPSTKVDLLLGTQGWRRFVYHNPKQKYNQLDGQGERNSLQRLFNVENNKIIYRNREIVFEELEEEDGFGGGFGGVFGGDDDDDDNFDECFGFDQDETKKEDKKAIVIENVNKKLKVQEKLPVQEKNKEKKKEKEKEPNKEEKPELKMQLLQLDDFEVNQDKMEFEPENKPFRINQFIPNQILPVIRVYSHKKRENWNVEERIDFTNTLYFSGVETVERLINSKEFVTTIKFNLNDDITSFRVFVDGFDDAGNLGCSQCFVFNSQKPFYIEPKLPLEITSGDQVMVPVTIVNSLDRKLNEVIIKGRVQGAGLILEQESCNIKLQMQPLQRTGRIFPIQSQNCRSERHSLTILGRSIDPNLQDQVQRSLLVKSPGFPFEIKSSGIAKVNKETEPFAFKLAGGGNYIKGSTTARICAYPSPSSNITESLCSLISEPCGCFEQTSNTVYPMVMAIQYIKNHENDQEKVGIDEKFMQNAYTLLEKGYQKLVGYECSKGGFEWFGGDPAHEALTAMGIMEFSEMRKIWDKVDDKMLQRTTDWILSRRSEETGGFKRNSQALDSFGRAPTHITDAYIVWALTKAGIGYGELERQFEKLEKDSKGEYKDDSYYLAMVGLALFNVGFIERSKYYAEQLVGFLDGNETGEVKRSKTSITCSRGSNLSVETTSVAMLLWLEHNFVEHVNKANKFIHSKNTNGRFGSTQATSLALMALIKYDNEMTKVQKDGKINLILNDQIIQTMELVANEKEPIYFDDISEILNNKINENKLENVLKLQMIDGCNLPYSIYIESRVKKIPSDQEKCDIILNTTLNVGNNNQIKEGETTEIKVNLKNKQQKKGLGMVVAIISLPAGLQPRYKKLQEMKKTNVVSSFELFGAREVVFYWRCMAPKQEIDFTFDVIAEIPGTYYGLPSRAYVYYDDDNKYWNDPFKIEIVPKIKN